MTTGSLDLSGVWQLSEPDGAYAADMNVPGDGITALVAAGHAPEPYTGMNEAALRWIGARDWVMTRRFDWTGTGPAILCLDGLDTVAEVAINGAVVLEAASSFRPHEAEISSALRNGENEIAITFRSSVLAAAARAGEQPYPVPYSTDNSAIPHPNMLRKAQCDFGWDWNIALAPFGLYGTARILCGPDPDLAGVFVRQVHDGRGGVAVSVTLDIRAFGAGPVPVTVAMDGETVTRHLDLTTGTHQVTETLTLTDPALWWPNGAGEQTRATLDIRVGPHRYRRKVALRDIRLEVSDGFRVVVNGRPIFAKGANWIPADALAGRITEAGVRDLLTSAQAAHMNMIRVWGGGRYEPEAFYDLCDELGLLVWQDFMFSCALYPADAGFLDEVGREVQYQARRLAHRVAVWCGDNELVGALNWFEESRQDRDRYLAAYDRLNHTIERTLLAVLPEANWWPSSPSRGRLDFGDAWHDDSRGDMHFWSVWHEGRDFEHYRDVSPRFCSEFGFQSYPSMDVIRRFAAPEDHNIAAPVLEAHQKNKGGNARIAETMFRYFRFPESFEDFVYLSQVQQGLAIQTAVDHWRGLKPHCMGTLYWQLNDTWPVASWSSLDHGGGWKILHHMARRFFRPVRVVAVPEDDQIALVAVSDAPDPVEMSVTASALSMDGHLAPVGAFAATLGGDRAVRLGEVPRAALGSGRMLHLAWTDPDGTPRHRHIAPGPYKGFDLMDPRLHLETRPEAGGYRLDISASAAAFFVAVEADQPGRLSDNAVLIRPDAPAVLHFTPEASGAATPGFRLRDLHSATYGRTAP